MNHAADPEENERQQFINEHVYRRQVVLGAGVLAFLLLGVLSLRLFIRSFGHHLLL